MSGSKRLLVIDDEPQVCDAVRRIAETAGYRVATASSNEEFIAAYDALKPSVIVMDLAMPGVDGIALLEVLRERGCKARIIIMTGLHPDLLKSATRLAHSYDLDVRDRLHKPFRSYELVEALRLIDPA